MIDAIGLSATPPKVTDSRDAKLRKAAQDLEGVFVQQLFKTMRETVPQQDGIVSGGAGEDMFTGLLDQHVAAETPKHWSSGLADAVYRQMRRGLSAQESAAASAAVAAPNSDSTAL